MTETLPAAAAEATRFDGYLDAYVPPARLTIDPSVRLHTEAADAIDPVTYEVLRHNLWSVNEEHGITMLRVSGSPIAAFGCDFNPCLLTEDAEFVYSGPYLQFFSSMQDLNVKWILENRSANPGIGPGDMFIANDPWVGTNHQLDVMLACPVFHEGAIFCWVTNALHFADLGGGVPGGWNPSGQTWFEEPPAFQPIKLMEGGVMRRDIEDMWCRRSRLPDLTALDLRAVVAGAQVAARRIEGLVARYGAGVVKAAMRRIVADSHQLFCDRIALIPDGTWRERVYLEIANPGDRGMYELALTMRKEGGTLTFDSEGTDPQVGAINVTYTGWRGAIMCVINAFLVPDSLYAVGGPLRDIVFRPTPGTILNASPPAAVANGSGIGVEATVGMCNNLVARAMDTAPQLRRMYTANGGATSWPIVSLGGLTQRGKPFQNIFLDFYAAPLGAFTFRDGVDTGSPYWMAKTVAPNVEQNEQLMPVLYLWQSEVEDSAGAGTFVGGATIGIAFTAHKTESVLHQVATSGVTQPTGPGLYGGMPGPPNAYRFRPADGEPLADILARDGRLDLADDRVRALSPKEANLVQRPGDVYEVICCGAAGLGDPLDRDPALVAQDVATMRFSAAAAEELFGVVLDGDAPDAERTARRRSDVRRERLARAGAPTVRYDGPGGVRALAGITGALTLGEDAAGELVLCSRHSGEPLCRVADNYREACARLDLPITASSPLAVDPAEFVDAEMQFRLFLCPQTGSVIETEVARAGAPVLHDIALDETSLRARYGS
ncbi:hypothetical protein FSW04_04775 [Baekduia soli]|uniref:Hydantoinase B/oxoprolinase domain-containing protein n=1 Tax=Baekduia soli TaxID=496014 RepID=A0A5B8U1Y9_9ACTN|nr:hydantoinase B/oxoprolinase family protein [Baekduia soli]QEC46970.1 hypothetical protein FSW04_04775 [Baekduia soli]